MNLKKLYSEKEEARNKTSEIFSRFNKLSFGHTDTTKIRQELVKSYCVEAEIRKKIKEEVMKLIIKEIDN